MPAPQLQSVESARAHIEDMLSALSDPDGFGYSKTSLDESLKLTLCERAEDNRSARIVCKMLVTEKMANQLGNMHGGCVATMLDNLTSMVLYMHTSGVSGDSWSYLGVSQSLQVLYYAPCPVGSWIDIECSSLSVGKSVSVLQGDIYLKESEDGARIKRTAGGTHTKVDNSSMAKL